MTCYFDTSALAKLVVDERETAALTSWFAEQDDNFIATNVIGVVELQRTALRAGATASTAAASLLARIDRMELSPEVLRRAAQLPRHHPSGFSTRSTSRPAPSWAT